MATSGTSTFRPEIDEIVTEACERCGLDPTLIDRKVAVSARRSLNLMFSEWSVRGVNYWCTAETTLSLTASTRNYSLPVGTIDVLTAVLRRDGNDTLLTRLSMTDYNAQVNKTSEGKTSQYFFDRQYTPQIYLWPVPENSTDTIIYWGLTQLEDATASYQDTDVPYRWTEAMCSGLAARLSLKLPGVPNDRIVLLSTQAEISFKFAADEEGEKAALRIIPM
jgi:hypothetical protein|tara:strand:- start:1374 stop:2036 length:663 start_codon:yes stop_codon:yes gene_type:complete